MSRYPGATWKPIGTGGSVLMNRYDIAVIHTMVGSLFGTDNYFRTQTPNNSHFGLGGLWGADATRGLDGDMWQWIDTKYRSAATRDGNPRVIALECADNAPASPSGILGFSAKQQESIVNWLIWCNQTHGIPLTLIHDSRPTSRGIGYHKLGCDPYRIAGGELWSSSYGKVCPGDVRIGQIPGLILRAKAKLAGQGTGGLFVTLTDAQEKQILNAVLHLDAMFSQNNTAGDINAILTDENLQGTALAALAQGQLDLDAKLDVIKQSIDALGSPLPPAA